MYISPKKKVAKRLYQVIGIAILCVLVIFTSYNVTSAWFMDESITSNGKPNIMIVGTVDLSVKSNFNFYNLVLAPDTYYTTYTENGVPRSYGTYLTTSEDNDVKTIYVRGKFYTNRSELTLHFEGNTTTGTTYSSSRDLNKWYLHTDGYYYYIGSIGTTPVEFNAGYHIDNTLRNETAYEDVTLEFVFESIQRPYGAYHALWDTAPTIFKQFASADTGV